MKIGVLIDALHSGGVEKIAIRQVEALNNIGQKAILLVLKRTSVNNHPFASSFKRIPVVFLDDRLPSVLKISFRIPFFTFFSWYHIIYPLLLPWVVGKGDCDVIISHGTYTTFTAISLKILKNIRFIATIWDPMHYIIKKSYPTGMIKKLNFILLPLARYFDQIIVRWADGIIVAGKAHVPFLKSLGSKTIAIVYPGVDPSTEVSRVRQRYILALTSWNPGKQPEYNLKIIKEIPSVTLVMAGNWHPQVLETDFRKKIKAMKLENRVKVTGSLKEKDLEKLYSEAAVFLQTNDDRGFGMPALEAVAHGCPFVIPQGQGVGELFSEGEGGYYTKERDTEDIIVKIKLLLNNPKLAMKLGESGWKKVVGYYSWEKHAQSLLKEINWVIK